MPKNCTDHPEGNGDHHYNRLQVAAKRDGQQEIDATQGKKKASQQTADALLTVRLSSLIAIGKPWKGGSKFGKYLFI